MESIFVELFYAFGHDHVTRLFAAVKSIVSDCFQTFREFDFCQRNSILKGIISYCSENKMRAASSGFLYIFSFVTSERRFYFCSIVKVFYKSQQNMGERAKQKSGASRDAPLS